MQPIYVFADAFSAEDTARFRTRANAEGFHATGSQYPESYRNNDRVLVDDPELAEHVLSVMRAHLPAELVDEHGERWRLRGLNSRFRFCRYTDGQSFSVHRDGVYYAGARAESRLTFMIYLNDSSEFDGGETRFFASRDRSTTTMTVAPRRGTLIVFDHTLWHEGAAVDEGTKYVMRSDVIYERTDGQAANDGDTSGHQGYVWQLSQLADGSLVSSGRDKTIRRWHVGESLRQQAVLRGHSSSVSAVAAVGPDGMWSGARDGTICRWRGDDKLGAHVAHSGAVLSIVELPDGNVATSSADGSIKLWTKHGVAVATVHEGAGWIWQLAVRNDGMLVVANERGAVELWSPASATRVGVLDLGEPARCVAITDDWDIVAGGSEGTICVWRGSEVRARFRGHSGAVRALTQLPGRGLLSAGEDDRAVLWNANAEPLAEFAHDDFVTALCWLGDHRFATASYDGSVRAWSTVGGPTMAPESEQVVRR